MSRLFGLAHYIRSVYHSGVVSSSWMAAMLCATPKHSRPGDSKALSSKGKSHYGEHRNENGASNDRTVDKRNKNRRKKTSEMCSNQFGDDQNAERPLQTQYDELNMNSDKLRHANASQDGEVEGRYNSAPTAMEEEFIHTSNCEDLNQQLGVPDTDDNILKLADFDESHLSKINFDSCDELDKYALREVETAFTITNQKRDNAEKKKGNDYIKDTFYDMCGDHCDAIGKRLGLNIRSIRSGISGFSDDAAKVGQKRFNESKELSPKKRSKLQDAKKSHPNRKPDILTTTPTYRPFRTIEVPISAPDTKELKPDNFKSVGNGLIQNTRGKTEIQADVKDPESRRLMRFALLRALHRLEAGNGKFSAKIIITDP